MLRSVTPTGLNRKAWLVPTPAAIAGHVVAGIVSKKVFVVDDRQVRVRLVARQSGRRCRQVANNISQGGSIAIGRRHFEALIGAKMIADKDDSFSILCDPIIRRIDGRTDHIVAEVVESVDKLIEGGSVAGARHPLDILCYEKVWRQVPKDPLVLEH